MIKAIIFDLGNVLVFYNRERAYKAFAQHLPLEFEEIGQRIEDSEYWKDFELGKMNDAEFFLNVINLFEPPHTIDFEHFARMWSNCFTTNRALLTIVERIKDKVELVMLSNTNSMDFEHIEQNHSEALKLFEGKHVLSFQEQVAKPDSQIYAKALERAGNGLNFEDCLYVDDILGNVAAATQLGMKGHHYVGLLEFVMDLKKYGLY